VRPPEGLKLGITHLPGSARAEGNIERLFRLIQECFVSEHTADNLDELNSQLQGWINRYNNHHVNRDSGCIPLAYALRQV